MAVRTISAMALLVLLAGCRKTEPVQPPQRPAATAAQVTATQAPVAAPESLPLPVVHALPVESRDRGASREFVFRLGELELTLDEKGRLKGGGRTAKLDLGGMRLWSVQAFPYRDQLLLLTESGNEAEESDVTITRVELPSLEVVLTGEMSSMYPGPAVIEGSDLYIGAAGFVGRMNIGNVSWVWTHEDLYRHGFRRSAEPVVYSDRVVFGRTPDNRGALEEVVVDRHSGGLANVPPDSP